MQCIQKLLLINSILTVKLWLGGRIEKLYLIDVRLEFYLSKAGWIVRVWSTSRANALCHWGLSGSKNFTRRDKNISHSVTCNVMREKTIKWIQHNKMIILFIQIIFPFLVGLITPMTSKVQQSCRLMNINFIKKTRGRGWIALVLRTVKVIISLISPGTIRQTIGQKNGQNRKKKTRRSTSAIWRLFAEPNNP